MALCEVETKMRDGEAGDVALEWRDMALDAIEGGWLQLGFRNRCQAILGGRSGSDVCYLIFCLQGTLRLEGIETPENFADALIGSGQCAFLYAPADKCCDISSVDGEAWAEGVQFSRLNLLRMIRSGALHDCICKADDRHLSLALITDTVPAMDHILRLAEDHMNSNGTNSLLLMAKAMELVWLFEQNCSPSKKLNVSSDDLKVIRKAKIILEENMASPPSLDDLADRVGMSLSKLKTVFRKVYGRPPYAYLRQQRMERALYLLFNTEMSVIQVAFEVGYASPSRFSRAFADQYGFNPSEIRRMG